MPQPAHAHDLNPRPRPGPVLQRRIHCDAAAQHRGRGGTAQRVGDLDDEVHRHAHTLAVPVAATAVAEHAVVRPDELLRAVVLLPRAALIAVRPQAADSWRSARRLL